MIKVTNINKVDTTKYSEGTFFISDKKLFVLLAGEILPIQTAKTKRKSGESK